MFKAAFLVSSLLAAAPALPSVAAVAVAADGAEKNELDEKSLALTKRIVQKMKDLDSPENSLPASWTTLLRILESSFLSNDAPVVDGGGKTAYQSSQNENEGRIRALRWMANEDEGPSLLSEDVYDRGLLQRYSLATVYFSTSGDDSWTLCSRRIPSVSADGGRADGDDGSTPCESDDERYLSGRSHFDWSGIRGKDGLVTWLDLSGRGLVSSTFLPLELILLSTSLELLWVSENDHLGGTLPDYLGEFGSLASLSVYKTSVSGSVPESIYSLTKLNSLRLYKSKFEGTISSNISQLTELKWLWIHDNLFTGSLPKEMEKLVKLEGLTLQGNNFAPAAVGEGKAGVEANNVIPELLCRLRKVNLKHLWSDCEEGSLEPPVSSEEGDSESGTGFIVKEGARACSCCTRCFPRRGEKVATAVAAVN